MTISAKISRRQTLAGAAALAAAGLIPGAALAQARTSVAELLKPGALPDVWLGSEKAPVSIVEYASMTCSHCAAFHNGTFKELKSKYIDTGKARFTVREFPFDPLSMAGFMLARCQGPEKREAMIDLLFAQQNAWVNDKPLEGLTALTRQAGMSEEAFKKCLDDKDLYEKIGAVRDRGQKEFKVSSTPTFFVNGVQLQGNQSLAEFERVMAEFLK
jgi:protein-disulfide isomerase